MLERVRHLSGRVRVDCDANGTTVSVMFYVAAAALPVFRFAFGH